MLYINQSIFYIYWMNAVVIYLIAENLLSMRVIN